jgi:uncharacterized membrane protein
MKNKFKDTDDFWWKLGCGIFCSLGIGWTVFVIWVAFHFAHKYW